MDVGDAVAAYGAILATALAFRQARQGRKNVKLNLETAYPDAAQDDPRDHGPPYIVLRVVNLSSTPIEITSVGLQVERDYRRIPDAKLTAQAIAPRFVWETTRLLQNGTQTASILEDDIWGIQRGYAPERLVGIWARDATGHRFFRRLPAHEWRPESGFAPEEERPPIVRSKLSAKWIAVWIRVSKSGRLWGVGPRLVRLLHRLRLFPVKVPW